MTSGARELRKRTSPFCWAISGHSLFAHKLGLRQPFVSAPPRRVLDLAIVTGHPTHQSERAPGKGIPMASYKYPYHSSHRSLGRRGQLGLACKLKVKPRLTQEHDHSKRGLTASNHDHRD
jgi:hypothetical protein